jgi:hypothetical protein
MAIAARRQAGLAAKKSPILKFMENILISEVLTMVTMPGTKRTIPE